MQIVLYQPEIPPNTGNVARLCAATGTRLNLIEPLGFSLDDKYLKRAGLDYWPHVDVRVWPGWDEFLAARQGRSDEDAGRLVLTSSNTGERFDRFCYRPDDMLVLGPETRGLPSSMFAEHTDIVSIPIRPCVRSLNLSTAAGILLYTALSSCGEVDMLWKSVQHISL